MKRKIAVFSGARSNGQPCKFTAVLRVVMLMLLLVAWSSAGSFSSYFGEDEFDIFNCVISDTAGGKYLVGGLGKPETRSVGWIVRVDDEGNRLFDRSIEPMPGMVSVLMDALVLPDGDLIAVGKAKFTGRHRRDDGWVVRLSAEGTEVWNRRYDFNQQERFYFIEQARDGLILTGGRIETASAAEGGKADGLLVWIDPETGDVRKAIREGTDIPRAAFYDAAQMEDGGLALAGWATDPALETDDVWVVRLSVDHKHQWSKRWGGAGNDIGRSLVADPRGLVVFGWGRKAGADQDSALALRFDNNGREEWARLHQVGASGNDRFFRGAPDGDAGYIVVGSGSGSRGAQAGKRPVDKGWGVRLDSQGRIRKQVVAAGPRQGSLYGVLAQGDHMVAAGYAVLEGSNNADAWLTALALGTRMQTDAKTSVTPGARVGSPSDALPLDGSGNRLKTCYAKDLKASSKRARVSIDLALARDAKARTQEPLRLRWQFRPPTHDECSNPLYLVLSMPERVRFRGEKFIALPPKTPGPFDLAYQSQNMRVLIPLHVGPRVWSGEMDIEIIRTGSFTLDWALVEIPKYRLDSSAQKDFAFGKWALVPGSAGSRSFDVSTGPPTVVIQDLFSTDVPEEVLYSNSDEFILEVYDGRYRVLGEKGGNLIIERDGFFPNFSPSSRFLGAYRDNTFKFDVVDLYSGRLVSTVSSGEAESDYANAIGEVAWGAGDAFMAASFSGWGAVAVCQTLVEDWLYTGGGGSHPSAGWSETSVQVDIENGLLRFAGGFSDLDRYWAEEELDLTSHPETSVRDFRRRDEAQAGAPAELLVDRQPSMMLDLDTTWDLTGPLKLSHDGSEYEPSQESGGQSPRYVIHRRENADGRPSAEAAGTLLVRGYGIPGNGRGVGLFLSDEAADGGAALDSGGLDSLADRLEGFGLHLAPLEPVHHMLPPPEPVWEDYGDDRDAADSAGRVHTEDEMKWQRGVLRKLVGEAPEASAQIIPHEQMDVICPFPEEKGIYDWTVRRAWRWEVGSFPVWLLQSYCVRGTGIVGAGQLALFAPGEGGGHVHWLFSQGMPDEPTWSMGTIAAFDERLGLNESEGSKAMLSHERYLILVGANETLLVYDLKTHRIKAFFEQVPYGDLVSAVRLTTDARHLVQVNSDGRFYIYNLSEKRQVLSGYYLDDEVVLFTDQGYYWATPEGAHFVFLRFPGMPGYHSFQQFQKTLDRPDIIRSILADEGKVFPDPNLNTPPTAMLMADLETPSSRLPESRSFRDVPLTVNASAEGNLASVRIFRDGLLVQEVPIGVPSKTVEVVLRVPAETRWITAVAVDERGFESTPQSLQLPLFHANKPSGRLFAIVIGTDTYAHLSDLGFARSDARAFANSLRSAKDRYYNDVQIRLLLDESDLGSVLRTGIESLKREATREDTVMLFAAGHGVRSREGRFFLAGRETDPKALDVTAVNWDEIAESLTGLRARVIVFLDACHSGAAGGGSATNDDAVTSLLRGKNAVTVISASKGRQASQEHAAIGGGVFSMSLAELIVDADRKADANGNRVLELSEVYGALKRRVVRMTSGAQTPWIARNQMVGEIPLF